MTDHPYNVLFLCTGNSARSVLAESLLNHWGQGKFRAYSAGSFPKGQVHPISIALLERLELPTDGLRSKSWDELPCRERRRSTLYLRSATTRPERYARSGPATR